MNVTVRRQLVCRWPVPAGCLPQRCYLGGRRDPHQRLHDYEHSFVNVKAAPVAIDTMGNPVSFMVARPPGGSVISRFDVTVRSEPPASAFDRPWEHAAVTRGGRARRVDPLALSLSEAAAADSKVEFAPFRPLRVCIRDLRDAYANDPDRMVAALRSRGIAARVVVGIALTDDPHVALRGEVYTPDRGWQALEATPLLSIAALASTAELSSAAGPHCAESINYESF